MVTDTATLCDVLRASIVMGGSRLPVPVEITQEIFQQYVNELAAARKEISALRRQLYDQERVIEQQPTYTAWDDPHWDEERWVAR